MASTKVLKTRIRSVRSTRQITKAMELDATTRLRKVQEAARSSRAYSQIAYRVLQRVSGSTEAIFHPYFQRAKDGKKKLYVIMTSDRGLAGAFNSNVQSATLRGIKEDHAKGISVDIVVFGRRGARFFARLADVNLVAVYEQIADTPDPEVFAPVFEMLDDASKNHIYRQVTIVYTEFVNTLTHEVQVRTLLPITPPADMPQGPIYEFEPSPEVVLERAAQLYLQSQLMQARLDSAASEHAMRMLAMSNASKNADDLVDDLTLELNATRQAAITQELAEITGGAEAIK